MPLHPQALKLQEVTAGLPRMWQLPLESARELYSAAQLAPREEVEVVRDLEIPGPGGSIRLRLYHPGGGTLPVLLYLHGGGFIWGDLESHDGLCRMLARRAACAVVAVDYRLAPGHPYPAPLDDCVAALQWVAANGSELGVDPGRLAVGGDSAGGNLAAAACLRARDRGGPAIRFQLLVYPGTAFEMTESRRRNGNLYPITEEDIQLAARSYLPDESVRRDGYAAPLHAADLARLPPALVISAEYDPLLDESEAYARRLEQAGVPVRLSRYDEMIHGFFQMPSFFAAGLAAIEEAAAALRVALSKAG